MTPAPSGAVELLERALAYTRGALVRVTDRDLSRATPCRGWSLDALLAHMDDALDAFTEAAGGAVAVDRQAPLETRVGALQVKACSLLGAWSGPLAPPTVSFDGLELPTDVVVLAAALEITVHGWDVHRATGHDVPIPAAFARRLLPVAAALVADEDRDVRFARPLGVAAGAPDDVRLLAFLGRDGAAGRALAG